MKRLQLKSLPKVCSVGALFFTAPWALAVGPSYQYIPDPVPGAIPVYNDVVALSNSAGFDGSGTVIGSDDFALNGTQTEAVFAILTANHVAIGNITTASFGAGTNAYNAAGVRQTYTFTANVNPAFQTYTLFDPTSNPDNLPEDISIMQAAVIYPTNTVPAAVTTLMNDASRIDNAFGGNPGAQSVGFTQAGYGQGGVWNGTAMNLGNAYNGNLKYDARRFQNNTSTNLNAPAIQTYGNYFEPIVNDKVLAPSAPGATGAGFDGDSGGPWFTGGSSGIVTDSPQNPNDYNTTVMPAAAPVVEPSGNTVANNTNLTVNYSNFESGVFVAISQIPDANYVNLNSNQLAVPLLDLDQTQNVDIDNESTQGSFEWADFYQDNPISVPEPASVSLIALGGVALLRRRSRQ
jgi:hypothetical protein